MPHWPKAIATKTFGLITLIVKQVHARRSDILAAVEMEIDSVRSTTVNPDALEMTVVSFTESNLKFSWF